MRGESATPAIPESVLALTLAAARDSTPRETCGLLLGRERAIESAIEIANIAPDPSAFVMDPLMLAREESWARSRGARLLGLFHSHAMGPPEPSIADRVGVCWGAYWSHVHLIVNSAGDWRLYDVTACDWQCISGGKSNRDGMPAR